MSTMTIPASEFKAHCLQLIDEIATKGGEITVTKRGKPMVKMVPLDDAVIPSPIGFMKGTVTIVGDIMAPLDVEWEANKD